MRIYFFYISIFGIYAFTDDAGNFMHFKRVENVIKTNSMVARKYRNIDT